jgi:hypothetical protein
MMQTTTEFFQAENYAGVGQGQNLSSPSILMIPDISQEHLQCLNRGPTDTGPEWMEANFSALAAALTNAQAGEKKDEDIKRIPRPLDVQLFWGWEDRMVPRKGQRGFFISLQPRTS